jgi:hypothetical protein
MVMMMMMMITIITTIIIIMCVTKENFTDCNVPVKKALLSRAIILLVFHPPHVALPPRLLPAARGDV